MRYLLRRHLDSVACIIGWVILVYVPPILGVSYGTQCIILASLSGVAGLLWLLYTKLLGPRVKPVDSELDRRIGNSLIAAALTSGIALLFVFGFHSESYR